MKKERRGEDLAVRERQAGSREDAAVGLGELEPIRRATPGADDADPGHRREGTAKEQQIGGIFQAIEVRRVAGVTPENHIDAKGAKLVVSLPRRNREAASNPQKKSRFC